MTDVITDLRLEFLENGTDKPFCLLYNHKAPHRNWMPGPQHLDLYFADDLPLPPTFSTTTKDALRREEADMRIEDLYLSLDLKLHGDSYDRETGTGGKAGFDPEPCGRRRMSG